MTPMYKTITNLPLFKGLSSAQISNFLEKTPISFSQYEAGMIICKEGTTINTLKCLIGGCVKMSHTPLPKTSDTKSGIANSNATLIITETIEAPAILEAEKLFGMDKTVGSDIVCTDKTSIMELTKEQYIRLLQSDQIYLINYLNYLSIRAQSLTKIFSDYPHSSLKEIIDALINSCVTRSAKSIEFKYDIVSFAEYCNMSVIKFKNELTLLENKGLISQNSEGFVIPSRKTFINDTASQVD